MNKEIQKIKPNGIFTNYIYKSIPLAFDESMSYYETLCGLLSILKTQEEVINNNADLLAELELYVQNYFKNLDVQTEINNKLDEMAENGQLTDIIAQYLELAGVLSFNTINDMKNATNINNGSTCKTLGENSFNDGLGRFYKIRNITNNDVIDNINIIPITTNNNLIAELIKEKYINDIGNIQDLKTPVVNNLVNAINSIDKLRTNSNLPDGTTFHLIAGAIRQDENNPNQWYFINDSNHEPVGVSNVEIQNNYLKITYDQTYNKVISLMVSPDETLSSLNITTGASVGLDHSLLAIGCTYEDFGKVYYDGTQWVDTKDGTVSFSNGILTLTPNDTNLHLLSPYGFKIQNITRGYATYKEAVQLESGLRVSFYDADGNKITTPTNDLAFKYWITHSGFIYPYTKMPSGSNIWFLGLMAKYPDNYNQV